MSHDHDQGHEHRGSLEELLFAKGLPRGSTDPGEAERRIGIIRAEVDRIRRGERPFAIIHK